VVSDDFADVLRRHVLLLRLDEPELALVAVALGVELVPLAGLLHQLRLQLRRRQRLGALRRPGRRRRRKVQVELSELCSKRDEVSTPPSPSSRMSLAKHKKRHLL